jgi:hypothetical protein
MQPYLGLSGVGGDVFDVHLTAPAPRQLFFAGVCWTERGKMVLKIRKTNG